MSFAKFDFDLHAGDYLTLIFCINHKRKPAKLMCKVKEVGDDFEKEYVVKDGIKLDLQYNLAASIPLYKDAHVEMMKFDIL